ncbi:hypothetical protein HPP92_001187 [Vanilla planifolia]|uniref:Gnk2-homologous domain-containing protein n=1 Tax=Vanilla planifolia TaxID=51239 RepID=A0A835VL57_VANPL|nr:hypothetical protein HPP92_001336 [Vanilla planifolia]KAG0501115.1 hypothetical protein HPP92_001187 [Vanilla planifolia]
MSKSLLSIALLLLVSSAARQPPIIAAQDTDSAYVLCNDDSYTAGDPFTMSKAYVLSDLIAATPFRPGHDYYSISPYPNSFAYGHASCGGRLDAGDCQDCLVAAVRADNDSCPLATGASAWFTDCFIRYEQHPFV